MVVFSLEKREKTNRYHEENTDETNFLYFIEHSRQYILFKSWNSLNLSTYLHEVGFV